MYLNNMRKMVSGITLRLTVTLDVFKFRGVKNLYS